jgi:hypothetical protein
MYIRIVYCIFQLVWHCLLHFSSFVIVFEYFCIQIMKVKVINKEVIKLTHFNLSMKAQCMYL